MIHIGIDLHSNNIVNVALNDNGEVVRETKLPTVTRSLEDFFGDFDEPVQAVVECTSSWYWLSDWCRDNNFVGFIFWCNLSTCQVVEYS